MMAVMAVRLLLLLQRGQRLLRVFHIARLQILADLLERLGERPVALSCG
jgi:hypothetical protein